MSKAVAVQAIFLIAVIAITLLFVLAIFWGWIDTTKLGTSQATCSAKKVSYCSSILNDRPKPFVWNTKEPINCDQFGIKKPINKADCQQ
ncbi:MAG: hypothetical protein HYW23_03895 [Candidatus Aenigmarchaeota archaeon]|nr:hypothetical protein [Candidatus Aenigmarchaeota archaeon]